MSVRIFFCVSRVVVFHDFVGLVFVVCVLSLLRFVGFYCWICFLNVIDILFGCVRVCLLLSVSRCISLLFFVLSLFSFRILFFLFATFAY